MNATLETRNESFVRNLRQIRCLYETDE